MVLSFVGKMCLYPVSCSGIRCSTCFTHVKEVHFALSERVESIGASMHYLLLHVNVERSSPFNCEGLVYLRFLEDLCLAATDLALTSDLSKVLKLVAFGLLL